MPVDTTTIHHTSLYFLWCVLVCLAIWRLTYVYNTPMCNNPITYIDKDGNKVFYPCGHCWYCLQSRRAAWTFRNLVEAQHHEYNYFVTLTYDDVNLTRLPYIPDAGIFAHPRENYQKYLKRLRKRVGQIRYFGASEYGGVSLRPHYHIIIYSDNKIPLATLQECWGLGYVDVTTVGQGSIHYLTKYITTRTAWNKHKLLLYQGKTFDRDNDPDVYTKLSNYMPTYITQDGTKYDTKDLFPELMIKQYSYNFQSTKPAIGYQFLSADNIAYIRNYFFEYQTFPPISMYGRKFAIPRYYLKRIFSTDEMQSFGYEYLNNSYDDYYERLTGKALPARKMRLYLLRQSDNKINQYIKSSQLNKL